MHTKFIATAFLLLSVAACLTPFAYAQKQTDIAGSVYGAFNGTTSVYSEIQSPSNSAGAMLEFRHIHNSLVGFEATYSYSRASQKYSDASPTYPPCPPPGGCLSYTLPATVSANANALTGDWVISRTADKVRPFALAGGGVLLVTPSAHSGGGYMFVRPNGPTSTSGPTGQNLTSTATEFLFVFGGGLDWKLSQRIGIRMQYRYTTYKAPMLATTNLYTGGSASSNHYTHSQQPALGIYYRF